jgi:hypothetical protein
MPLAPKDPWIHFGLGGDSHLVASLNPNAIILLLLIGDE